MDGVVAIEVNRVALGRVVAGIAAMAGLRRSAVGNRQSDGAGRTPTPAADCPLPIAATLPRYLWRTVLRLLRPAESAARRLVIAMARGLVVTPPPPRFTRSPSTASQGRNFGRGRPQRGSSPVYGGGGAEGGAGGVFARLPAPRRIALPLFDPLPRPRPRRVAAAMLPRICVPGLTARLPVPVPVPAMPDDPIDATRLGLRLDALARVLDDLPSAARRFAIWRARTQDRLRLPGAAPMAGMASADAAAGPGSAAGGRRGAPGRLRMARLSPLRPGRPPGTDRKNSSGTTVQDILAHAHELAWWALEHPA